MAPPTPLPMLALLLAAAVAAAGDDCVSLHQRALIVRDPVASDVSEAIPAASPTAAKRALVVVRAHRPTKGMERNIFQLYEDVAKNWPEAYMLVSVDDSGLENDARWWPPIPQENVHRYTWADVAARFPKVDWPGLCYRKPANPSKRYCADGRTFHMEPLHLALDFARTQVNLTEDAVVWALEDDALVCGSFSELARSYASTPADFLAAGRHGARKWANRGFGTGAFLERYPLEERVYAMQFVERFSTRLLRKLAALSQEGVTAQSEMLAPTVSAREPGLGYELFRPEHVGNSTYRWDTRLSLRRQKELCLERPLSLHHGAKLRRYQRLLRDSPEV